MPTSLLQRIVAGLLLLGLQLRAELASTPRGCFGSGLFQRSDFDSPVVPAGVVMTYLCCLCCSLPRIIGALSCRIRGWRAQDSPAAAPNHDLGGHGRALGLRGRGSSANDPSRAREGFGIGFSADVAHFKQLGRRAIDGPHVREL
jgi:hypothetical protein